MPFDYGRRNLSKFVKKQGGNLETLGQAPSYTGAPAKRGGPPVIGRIREAMKNYRFQPQGQAIEPGIGGIPGFNGGGEYGKYTHLKQVHDSIRQSGYTGDLTKLEDYLSSKQNITPYKREYFDTVWSRGGNLSNQELELIASNPSMLTTLYGNDTPLLEGMTKHFKNILSDSRSYLHKYNDLWKNI